MEIALAVGVDPLTVVRLAEEDERLVATLVDIARIKAEKKKARKRGRR